MEYRNVKILNILLGVLCISLESYVYRESYVLARIDEIFLAITIFFLCESIFSIILCSNRSSAYGAWRIVAFGILAITGGLLTYSAISIENSITCNAVKNDIGVAHCHKFGYKLCAGIFAILNGVVYMMAKPEPHVTAGTIHVQTIIPSNNAILTSNQPPPPYTYGNEQNVLPPSYYAAQQNQTYPNNQFSYPVHIQQVDPSATGPAPGWKS